MIVRIFKEKCTTFVYISFQKSYVYRKDLRKEIQVDKIQVYEILNNFIEIKK